MATVTKTTRKNIRPPRPLSPYAKAVRLKEFLLLGSFGHPYPESVLGFPFIDEAGVAPSVNQTAASRRWVLASSASGTFNLKSYGWDDELSCAAYAFTYVRSPRRCIARLLMGSDDGIAAWVNGTRVWFHDVTRPVREREDSIDIVLDKGWNRLLLKIGQYERGWGFTCSIVSECALAFSARRPSGFRLRAPAAGPGELKVSAGQVTSGAGQSTVVLELALHNGGSRELPAGSVRLVDSDGVSISTARVGRIGPHAFVTVKVSCDSRTLASTLAAGAGALDFGGNKRMRVPLPDQVPRRVLAWTMESARMGEGAASAWKRLQAMMELHPVSLENHRAQIGRALDAFARSDRGGFASALQGLADQIERAVPDRSGDHVHVVGHAHVDMNWLWTYRETVKTCQDTFRQVIAFMKEYPELVFLQSQAAAYDVIERLDPALFAAIREKVVEGRWEVIGGMWTEGDTNLSGGEALARSLLLGQRYFLDRFGKAATVGWLPDNFGHVSQLPQILRLGGIDCFYGHRCQPFAGTFRWEGPDGSRVVCFANHTYNGTLTTHVERDIETYVPQTRRLLLPCGVGDHGGGPTRGDLENARKLSTVPKMPTIAFTPAREFFDGVENDGFQLPIHRGEMQYVFEGCYTSVSRIKEGNRICEQALYTAELLAALRFLDGDAYPADALKRAWEIVTYNEFHDILCGSAIHEANADAVADYKLAHSSAEEVTDLAVRALADQVAFDRDRGQPVVAFNTTPRDRTALVEAEVFTYECPATARLSSWFDYYGGHRVLPPQGNPDTLPTVMLLDSSGRTVTAQIVGGKVFPPGFRSRVLCVAEHLPACGYETFYVDTSSPGESRSPIPERNWQFDTDFYTVAFDKRDGSIRKLFDKKTGRELAAKRGGLNGLRVYLEDPALSSGWVLGTTLSAEDVTDVESVAITERGPVRACVEATKRWGNSKFIQRTWVYRSYPRVDFELEAHWFGQSGPKGAPTLRVLFPTSFDRGSFTCHVPFDVVERPADGHEVPAQRWVDVSDGKAGVALITATKYGYSCDKGELRLTLLRSFSNPDIYPDQGLHRIRYALFPHQGDWKQGVWDEADLFNCPVVSCEPPSMSLRTREAVRRPPRQSLLSLAPHNLVLSGVKKAEQGDELVVRVAEAQGRGCAMKLTCPRPVSAARRLDLVERPLGSAELPRIDGNTVSLAVTPHEIVTLEITMR